MIAEGLAVAAAGYEVYVPAAATVIATAITTAGLIFVATLPYIVRRRRERREQQHTRDRIESIHEQVANTHDTNLREDMDALAVRLDRISRDIGTVKRTTSNTDRKVRQVEKRLSDHIDGR